MANPEQVRVFYRIVGTPMDTKLHNQPVESQVNTWLRENDGKIEVISRGQSGVRDKLTITIWFRLKN